MKTYLDMDEILHHCRRYIGQEYDEPYLVSAVPEEVIRSLPAADVMEVRHGRWTVTEGKRSRFCSICYHDEPYKFADEDADVYSYCPNCGAKMDGWQNDG